MHRAQGAKPHSRHPQTKPRPVRIKHCHRATTAGTKAQQAGCNHAKHHPDNQASHPNYQVNKNEQPRPKPQATLFIADMKTP